LKGLISVVIDGAIANNDSDDGGGNAELRAALTLARRRKLGPFRKGAVNADRHRKDLAALARAGFSLDIARKVLGGGIRDEELF
jgi:regulatory protein